MSPREFNIIMQVKFYEFSKNCPIILDFFCHLAFPKLFWVGGIFSLPICFVPLKLSKGVKLSVPQKASLVHTLVLLLCCNAIEMSFVVNARLLIKGTRLTATVQVALNQLSLAVQNNLFNPRA